MGQIEWDDVVLSAPKPEKHRMEELITAFGMIREWHRRNFLPVPHLAFVYDDEYNAHKAKTSLKIEGADFLMYSPAVENGWNRLNGVEFSLVAPAATNVTAVQTIYGKKP